MDEIALRNILVADKQLKLADFGQSLLLPMETVVDTTCTDDLTSKTEILHLGWIIYSITIWQPHKYYYYSNDPPQWPREQDLPRTEHLFCGNIIKRCWNVDYISMAALHTDVRDLLTP